MVTPTSRRTRLFVGDFTDIGTDELSELVRSHGDMTDCVVLTDDAGVNRGFGFVTYAEKSMAEPPSKHLTVIESMVDDRCVCR